MRRRGVAAAILGVGLWSSAPCLAGSPADKASAEALFDEGRTLLREGKYAEACSKFEASQRLDPGVGTMLNLADCYEKSGRTASAWAAFREAASAAQSAGSAERAQVARARAEALKPQLSYLTIVGWKDESLVVTRDGSPVDRATLGTPMPVDPGSHEIVATAEGKRKWSTTVEVANDGARVSVSVPILLDEEGGAVGGDPSGDVPATGGEEGDPGATQKALAIAAGVVGVGGLAVGTVFGLKASSDWKDAKADCDPYPYCGADGVRREDDARTGATISTIAFAVGIAGVAGGAVLWLTAPSRDSKESVAVGLGPTGVVARGRF